MEEEYDITSWESFFNWLIGSIVTLVIVSVVTSLLFISTSYEFQQSNGFILAVFLTLFSIAIAKFLLKRVKAGKGLEFLIHLVPFRTKIKNGESILNDLIILFFLIGGYSMICFTGIEDYVIIPIIVMSFMWSRCAQVQFSDQIDLRIRRDELIRKKELDEKLANFHQIDKETLSEQEYQILSEAYIQKTLKEYRKDKSREASKLVVERNRKITGIVLVSFLLLVIALIIYIAATAG